MASCLSVVGIVWLVITNLAIIISFATPFWSEHYMLSLISNQGLWAKCSPNGCEWFFEDDFKLQNEKSMWFKAVQALFSIGLGFGLMALLFATFSLCCEVKRCNFSAAISTFLLLAFLSIGISLIVFGAKGNADNGINVSHVYMGKTFGWSYWLGVAAALLALLTSMLYACDCRRRPAHY